MKPDARSDSLNAGGRVGHHNLINTLIQCTTRRTLFTTALPFDFSLASQTAAQRFYNSDLVSQKSSLVRKTRFATALSKDCLQSPKSPQSVLHAGDTLRSCRQTCPSGRFLGRLHSEQETDTTAHCAPLPRRPARSGLKKKNDRRQVCGDMLYSSSHTLFTQ